VSSGALNSTRFISLIDVANACRLPTTPSIFPKQMFWSRFHRRADRGVRRPSVWVVFSALRKVNSRLYLHSIFTVQPISRSLFVAKQCTGMIGCRPISKFIYTCRTIDIDVKCLILPFQFYNRGLDEPFVWNYGVFCWLAGRLEDNSYKYEFVWRSSVFTCREKSGEFIHEKSVNLSRLGINWQCWG